MKSCLALPLYKVCNLKALIGDKALHKLAILFWHNLCMDRQALDNILNMADDTFKEVP